MKIIEQSHKIIKADTDELGLVETVARVCYKSEDKIGCRAKGGCLFVKNPEILGDRCDNVECNYHSAQRFVRMLINRGHTAMLEHATATVLCVTNRGVSHEIVRHRIASYAQESTRYVDYADGHIRYIRPVWANIKCREYVFAVDDMEPADPETPLTRAEELFGYACAVNEQQYKELRSAGWQPEQAREVLGHAVKTEIVITANLRQWRESFMRLRALGVTGRPHPQMRALMVGVLHSLAEIFPPVFADLLYEYKKKEEKSR
jgi:thymidylate synthase (FAD)